jgi:hypothetical protein
MGCERVISFLSVLFGDPYWTQVWAQSLHLQVMPSDEGTGVAVNWTRLLEHLGQDFVSVALTGSRLVSSVIAGLPYDSLICFFSAFTRAQRTFDALRIASRSCSGVMFAMRALPPRRPRATAKGFIPFALFGLAISVIV